jgi:hypothetical protein
LLLVEGWIVMPRLRALGRRLVNPTARNGKPLYILCVSSTDSFEIAGPFGALRVAVRRVAVDREVVEVERRFFLGILAILHLFCLVVARG